MPKFKKKPVVIEAVLFTEEIAKLGWPDKLISDHPWLDSAFEHGQVNNIRTKAGERYMSIKTLEGTMRADIGDWIIQGVKGELYPCKPDIFDMTYEIAALTNQYS